MMVRMTMKIGIGLMAGCSLALLQLSSYGADKVEFKDAREKASYGIGMYFGILLRTIPEVFKGENSW